MTRPPTTLDVLVRRDADDLHLSLSGRLDAHQVPGFLAAAEPLLARTVLDLGGVTFMDSSGLAALVRLVRTARAAGQDLGIVNVQDGVRLAMEITGLYAVLPIR
ncbi:STAS domain-containing protein [Deinococcus soli (ex Cha et al. 2016)]|uniref:Anti-anti-sigma factor n=2 Tax=Deinococcus soli (ex Cha et al. 2016) TaxID=1309411 RepID=A0ACC6KEC1_9DEIO|nr:STAS domain-containing protein [Deinococcus soli (ex Cha et al. 2016)]MDR6217801.1 anti-anti-sigma factor [Deinococcus soli (ex Cha et al. 2016)]MDR6328051.1 anti-anti-sigma factor [Deinococcus soli (ex Cha et al. 2016)]MDR6750903.1 anti-anti-sigma factor [Deinococcus soli (ex Cha et al. 2016)]